MKLTDFGAASPQIGMSKEDEQSAALAARAQKGDYDDGRFPTLIRPVATFTNPTLQSSSSNN